MNFIPSTKTRYEDRIAITRAILDDAGALPGAARPS
jgi:hypothetical protein